jgi:hypothetical protein
MIEIFNEAKGKLVFKNYDALLTHIKDIEKTKFLATSKEENWIFTIHPYERFAEFYWRAVKAINILLTEKEQDAYEKGFNLLNIRKGSQNGLDQVILTPDVNVKEIKKSWCHAYCLENGSIIFERKEER